MNELLLSLVISRHEIYDIVNDEKGACNHFAYSVIKPSHLIIVRSEICAWKNELNTKDSPNT